MNITNNVTGSGGPQRVEEAPWSRHFRIVVFVLITLASLFGNSVICKTSWEFPTRKPLSYHLVTNLAAAGLVSTVFLTFTFSYQLHGEWRFGPPMCSFMIPMQATAMFVVTNTLAVIAAYRFVFIVFQPSRRIVTRNKIILLLCVLWLYAVAVAVPLFVFQEEVIHRTGKLQCILSPFRGSETYNVFRFVLGFGVPYLFMLVSYGAVACKLRTHIKRSKEEEALEMAEVGQTVLTCIDHENDSAKMRSSSMAPTPQLLNRRRSTRDVVELEHDLLRMIYAIIISFVLCYLPYQIHYLVAHFGLYSRLPDSWRPYFFNPYFAAYAFLLTALPSALHPVFYGTMNKFYARSFSRLVLCRKD